MMRGCAVGEKCRCQERSDVLPYRRRVNAKMTAQRRSIPKHSMPKNQLANHARRLEPVEPQVALSTRLLSTGVGFWETVEVFRLCHTETRRRPFAFESYRSERRHDGYTRPG